jgi:hypothetical protein
VLLNELQKEYFRRLLVVILGRMKRKDDEDSPLAFGVTSPSDVNTPACIQKETQEENEEEVHIRRNVFSLKFVTRSYLTFAT